MKISICDYNVGNMSSVASLCRHFGYEPQITNDLSVMDQSDLLILPGQGAYATAMDGLKQAGCVDFIKGYVKEARPFLGICVGYQLLFEGSQEDGFTEGLGLFPGVFKKFEPGDLKVPHMGWNMLNVADHQIQYKRFDKDYVYFVHSYYLDQTDSDLICTTSEYGVPFVSSIASESLFAAQFHPEKSGDVGVAMLDTFISSVRPDVSN